MAWVPGYEERYNDYMTGHMTAGLFRSMEAAQEEGLADPKPNVEGYVYDNMPKVKANFHRREAVSPPEPPAIAQARAAARKEAQRG